MTGDLKFRPTSLTQLSKKEAERIGNSFASIVVVSGNPEAAVSQFIGNSVALRQLDEATDTFRPLLVTLAEKVAMKTGFGANMRLLVGSILSIFDTVTDATMVAEYFRMGGIGIPYAVGIVVGVILNLVINLMIVWMQNRKKGWKAVLTESLIAVTFIKPGIDSYKVAAGITQHEDSLFDPFAEVRLRGEYDVIFPC